MNPNQVESGDLRDIQRQHQKDSQKSSFSSSSSSNSSTASGKPPSLLERRQSSRLQSEGGSSTLSDESMISPMPTGAERMAALRDLGATFEEGQKCIAKVATPTETVVPSFVDSDHLEKLLHKKKHPDLRETCEKTVAH